MSSPSAAGRTSDNGAAEVDGDGVGDGDVDVGVGVGGK